MMPDNYLNREEYDWVIDYTLEVGDSLEEVAEAYATSVEEIAELNSELSAEQYVPGRTIRVPYRRGRRHYRGRPYPYEYPYQYPYDEYPYYYRWRRPPYYRPY
jgi:LysM repeat protein